MAYIRLSIARPQRGQEARLTEIMHKLAAVAEKQPGCRETFVLKSGDGSGDLARITIYENEAAGEAAANDASMMALRSEMHLIVDPDHLERAFFSV
ncbi:MAG: antibiotic biosynthesis monooxygenase [Chloroflexi bacterium]|nr:antibiotic biosynthesis monooxygenase [Chloroflexota bacterium]